MSDNITHKGKITKVGKSEVTVSIMPTADECGKCAISSLCNKSEEITIPYDKATPQLVGSEVTVSAPGSVRSRATMLFLLAPLIILISVFGISILLGSSEGLSSIMSIASVTIWYLILYILRIKIRRQAQFTIKSIIKR